LTHSSALLPTLLVSTRRCQLRSGNIRVGRDCRSAARAGEVAASVHPLRDRIADWDWSLTRLWHLCSAVCSVNSVMPALSAGPRAQFRYRRCGNSGGDARQRTLAIGAAREWISRISGGIAAPRSNKSIIRGKLENGLCIMNVTERRRLVPDSGSWTFRGLGRVAQPSR
jgi:hypothetical protein